MTGSRIDDVVGGVECVECGEVGCVDHRGGYCFYRVWNHGRGVFVSLGGSERVLECDVWGMRKACVPFSEGEIHCYVSQILAVCLS